MAVPTINQICCARPVCLVSKAGICGRSTYDPKRHCQSLTDYPEFRPYRGQAQQNNFIWCCRRWWGGSVATLCAPWSLAALQSSTHLVAIARPRLSTTLINNAGLGASTKFFADFPDRRTGLCHGNNRSRLNPRRLRVIPHWFVGPRDR